MLPSSASECVETVPSPKVVTNTYGPSALTTAQQTSLRVFPTGPASDRSSEAPSSAYDDADAFPTCAPAASVTTSVPSERKSNPYGVSPRDGWPDRASTRPFASSAN